VEAKTRTGIYRPEPGAPNYALVAQLGAMFLPPPKPKGTAAVRYAELMKLAEAVDVSTPRDGTWLWSGGGDRAGTVAQQMATQRTAGGTPSMRLEMTAGGAALVAACAGDAWEVQEKAWRTISSRLADGASGEINVVVSYMPLSKTAIFREEIKVLNANKNYTKINAWLMQESPTGTLKDDAGKTYELVPVSLSSVLAKPAPPKKKKTRTS
jgi:hypothetical protein